MACQDDAAFVGPVSLFLGVETANWSIQDFMNAAKFAKQHGVTSLFVKVFEVGSTAGKAGGGIWYGGMNGWDAIYQQLQRVINVIPYGYLWGPQGNLQQEIHVAVQLLQTYQKLCLDIEGAQWEGQVAADAAAQLNTALVSLPGKLWLSHPADFSNNNQKGFMQALSPSVNVYMPMAYSDSLTAVYQQDLMRINPQACIQPTVEINPEFGPNDTLANTRKLKADGCLAISVWEYQQAQHSPSILDQIVSIYTQQEAKQMNLILNSSGCVCDVAKSYQLENPAESQDLCGPWSASAMKYAGLPGKGALAPGGTGGPINLWASHEYVHYIGPDVSSDENGSSIDNMHSFFHDAGNLHYWDLNISPATHQSDDLANIRAALHAGYPVLVTVNEQSVISKRLGRCPYPWQPHLGPVNHVFPIVGVDRDGNFICADQLNNFEDWPQIYLAANIECHWGTIVQLVGNDPVHPWHAPIPSGDPTTWAADFNAQLFARPQPQPQSQISTDYVLQAALLEWNCSNVGAPFSTGIAQAWLADYRKGIFHGSPLDKEQPSKDWKGNQIVVHFFSGARCEWSNGQAHWYSYK